MAHWGLAPSPRRRREHGQDAVQTELDPGQLGLERDGILDGQHSVALGLAVHLRAAPAREPEQGQAGTAGRVAGTVPAVDRARADAQDLGNPVRWRVAQIAQDQMPNWQVPG